MQATYIRERSGADVLIEPGKGFATWKFLSPTDVYIVDLFVAPEYRRSGVGTQLADQIVAGAKAAGATRLIGSVDARSETRTDALRGLLAYGMSFDRIGDDGRMLWLSKEIG